MNQLSTKQAKKTIQKYNHGLIQLHKTVITYFGSFHEYFFHHIGSI